MKKIAVIGSINTDFVFRCKELPSPSETIMGDSFEINFGGKGANEAVAASRLGAKTMLFGKVGSDLYSKENLKNLRKEKVDISCVEVSPNVAGGSAGIMHGSGTNSIIVVGGANQTVDDAYLKKYKDKILKNDIFCLQIEIPFKTVEQAINMLYENGKTIIFNPSPMRKLSHSLLKKCSYVIVNEIEIQSLPHYSNLEDTLKAYSGKLIVTCGEDGVYHYDNGKVCHTPALKLKNVVDTTGAGDTFLAAFATALANDNSVADAVKFANMCAGIKTTKKGTQTGMPSLKDIENYI